jgi:hypothetical protein
MKNLISVSQAICVSFQIEIRAPARGFFGVLSNPGVAPQAKTERSFGALIPR